jgi:3-oxoacyl-[acyl-carrier protein] reductase
MKVDLSGRRALVTGAGDGIGRAIAIALAENGATVAVNDIDQSGEETMRQIQQRGGQAKFYRADVSDVFAVNGMVGAIEEELGELEILVNNAGISILKGRLPIHEQPDSHWGKILKVDLDGVFYCSRAASANMVKRRRGVIINIGSIAGIVPLRLQSAYASAKAAVLNFTRCHALEVGSYGIRVNAIAPGSIMTRVTKQVIYNPDAKHLVDNLLSHIPLGRAGEPDDIANAALYLASDEANYVTGHVLVVDGGWTAGFTRDW